MSDETLFWSMLFLAAACFAAWVALGIRRAVIALRNDGVSVDVDAEEAAWHEIVEEIVRAQVLHVRSIQKRTDPVWQHRGTL